MGSRNSGSEPDAHGTAGSSAGAGGSHAFSAHPRQQAELERLRRQALVAWPMEARGLARLGLANGMRVLDVGCGPGFVTHALAALNPDGETVGLEPDATLARIARASFEGRPGIILHEGDLAHSTLPAASFDFAYARFVFQHVASPGRALRALLGLLRPGGRAVLTDADDGLTAFYPEPPELATVMEHLAARQARAGGDRRIGRKLPKLMADAGFTDRGFEVVPLTSHGLGRETLLELAVSSRLQRVTEVQEPGIGDLAQRMHAFFSRERWDGVVCVVTAFGSRPAV